MSLYRKKPVVIEAFKLGVDHIPDWFMDAVTANKVILHGTSSGFDHVADTNADIHTLEGWHRANYGDYIIRGVKGEIYPCKADIFDMTYDVTDNNVGDKLTPTEPLTNCQQWIPVAERLPEENGNYLVVKNGYNTRWIDVLSFAKDGRKVDKYDFQRKWKNVWYTYDSEYGYITIGSVTHWKPLPELPKENE